MNPITTRRRSLEGHGSLRTGLAMLATALGTAALAAGADDDDLVSSAGLDLTCG